MLLYLEPLVAVAGAVALLGERLTPAMIGGGALILAGVAAASVTPTTSGRRRLPVPTIPWTTPKPAPPHDGPVTVMASRLELRRLSDVPWFLMAALRIRRQMLGSPGALGVSLIARPTRRTFWTLSAWQDQAALSATVGRQPHREIMGRFRPRMAGSGFVTWTAPALPVRWDDALRRLDNPDTVREPGRPGRAVTADGTPASRKESQ